MKRAKPLSRRPKAAKKAAAAPKKTYVVAIEMTAAPTPKQLAALKKAFRTRKLATLGIAPSAVITTRQASLKRPRR